MNLRCHRDFGIGTNVASRRSFLFSNERTKQHRRATDRATARPRPPTARRPPTRPTAVVGSLHSLLGWSSWIDNSWRQLGEWQSPQRWKERQEEGGRRRKRDGRQTRREERQQLGYFAATLTEEVTVKYTAAARRRTHCMGERPRAREHTHTHTHLTLGCSDLAVPLMKELNRQNLLCAHVCVCVRERGGEGTNRQQRQ